MDEPTSSFHSYKLMSCIFETIQLIRLVSTPFQIQSTKDPVGKPVDHMERTASLHSCSDEIFGGATHGSQHGVINRGGNSFASVLQAKSNKKVVKIQELRNENVFEGAAVAILFEAVEEVKSSSYDFFLFQFEIRSMDKVLEDGPWLIRTVPLILNVWSPNTDLKKAK
ncbi:zinc knuckle CX2CX4HX4C containing protein [Tanacetum coccineum]